MSRPLTIAIAGSTERTAACLSAMLADARLQVVWVLTPEPKRVGRKQLLTVNPLSKMAATLQLPIIEVSAKLDSTIRDQIAQQKRPDILVVVDFGYLVPDWLLQLPHIAPINIHPSALPRWRGSSPGQFVLLYGETESAVSLIVMNNQLDQGEVIAQLPFAVIPNWTTFEYYKHSFSLVNDQLPELLAHFAGGKLPAQTQPLASPTPTASRLSKADSFVPWELVQKAVHAHHQIIFETTPELGIVLTEAWKHSDNLPLTLERAVRAFNPWPRLWTIAPTHQGAKRLQFLSSSLEGSAFVPHEVLIEGKTTQQWHQTQFTT